MIVQSELVAVYDYQVIDPEEPFPSDLQSISTPNYLLERSIDWNDSGHVQYLTNVNKKMQTR